VFTRFATRLAVVGALSCAFTGCAAQASPTNWTLWYIPNEPKAGVTLSKLCHTFVFSNPPDAKTFRVVTVNGLSGNGKIPESDAYVSTGDVFNGPLELGPAAIHDSNAGYDLRVDVVYTIDSYLNAKARADADCPLPALVPKQRVKKAANPGSLPQPQSTRG
jgi:hypothetical protein